ncbi:MAG: Cas10/Cmr2 second palm domain-containing protein [Pseudonocardiaceae bacterium]
MFDLVLLSLGGVQRFISESRSTADVAGASEIVQKLARIGATAVTDQLVGSPEPCGLIFPAAPGAGSVTNKIAFLAAAHAGPDIARAAAREISAGWQAHLKETFKPSQPPGTPGTPDLAWVSVTGTVADGDYRALWESAQQEMVGRRRARVFEPFEIPGSRLCAQSPGLPAVAAPPTRPAHERGEALSAAGWVKRHAASQRFPSTVSIASSAFRRRLLERADADQDVAAALRDPIRTLTEALRDLNLHSDRAELRAVRPPAGLEPLAGRLGAWVTPERWDAEVIARECGTPPAEQIVHRGRTAANTLAGIAREAGVAAPSPYFAVVVQDLDRLGRALGDLDLDRQREVSGQLSTLAERQSRLLEKQYPLAELVYAGGDDLLAFCPAAEALRLAESLRRQVRDAAGTGPLATAGSDGTPITASTGVVFAHMSNPLQDAVRSAQQAIAAAKSETSAAGRSRDALAVLVRRRGGQRAQTVQPWWPRTEDGASATDLLGRIRPGPGSDALSAALGSELERDEALLHELTGEPELLRAELVRLVTRHGGTPEAGKALYTLGRSERAGRRGAIAPVPAALVARFLSQEAR